MPVFDDANRVLRCRVSELVDNDFQGVSPSGSVRAARARAGLHAHKVAREDVSGENNICTETPVRFCFNRPDGWRIELQGRVDLLRSTPAGLEIVEVKSTFLSGRELAGMTAVRSHREQCALYCLMLQRNGRPVWRGRLRYRSLAEDAQRDIDIGFSTGEAEAILRNRLDMLFDEHRRSLDMAQRKRLLAGNVVFPFTEQRAGQRQMIERAETVARDGGFLFCSAPTGIGKTAAALFPMVRAALAGDMRLFFVTAKVSQQELAVETLRRFVPSGSGVCAMQLMAKERSCPASEMRCDTQDCPYLSAFGERLEQSGILSRLEKQGTVNGVAIAETAAAVQLCPFEVSLALARRASVIVSDYNYVFDPRLALKAFFDEPTSSPLVLIVDEAHNLPERVRGYYSPEIDGGELRSVAALCARQQPGVFNGLASMLTEVGEACAARMRDLREEQGVQPVWIGDPDRAFFIAAAERAETLMLEYLFYRRTCRHRPPEGLEPQPRGTSRRYRDPVLSACFAVRDYGDVCRYDPQRFAGLWHENGNASLLCLDPAPFLRERLDYFHGAALMSATLSPFDFFLRMTGLSAETVQLLDLPSPFPRRNRLIAAVPGVDTRYRQRRRAAPVIAKIMQRIIDLRPGNYLAFFPSFAFRDQVVAQLPPGPYRVLIQDPAMDTLAVLEDLAANTAGTILLCAVQGGVFAEGVDYPGHLAVGAFIIGPGLPRVCPQQELIRAYHDEHDGEGFRHAYLYPGLNRVIQAGGRIIRCESDRGFIMLLDGRLAARGYREKLPQYWREELLVVDDPVSAVRRFWQQKQA